MNTEKGEFFSSIWRVSQSEGPQSANDRWYSVKQDIKPLKPYSLIYTLLWSDRHVFVKSSVVGLTDSRALHAGKVDVVWQLLRNVFFQNGMNHLEKIRAFNVFHLFKIASSLICQPCYCVTAHYLWHSLIFLEYC